MEPRPVNPPSDTGPEAFFRVQRQAFVHTIASQGPEAALQQAWDSFEGNVAIQHTGQPPVDCRKGCAACCALRVTATAPEVFTLAAFVRATAPALRRHGIDLAQRVRDADAATRDLDEAGRVGLRRRCAFIEQGVCLIHRVRPLACRGHASHDRRACADAAAGRREDVPFAGAYRTVRLLVQSALQAALRQRRLAWGAYELHHALTLALAAPGAATHWLAGADPLAPAAADLDARADMAAEFDRLAD